MRPYLLVAGILAAALTAGSAGAAVSVLGSSVAEDCSVAAFHDKADSQSLALCNDALMDPMLSPRDRAGTYVNRGVMWMKRNDFDHARADFDSAIRLEPKLGEGWVNRGAVNVGQRRYQEGVSDISRGLQLGIEEPEKAYYNRALAYEGLDDEKSAYLDYQQALVLKPGWELPEQELLRFTVSRR